MARQRILIHHGGHWERSIYVDGDKVMLYVDVANLSRDHLIHLIRDELYAGNNIEYSLFYFTLMEDGSKVKVLVRSDIELFRALVEQKMDPEIYVIERNNQPAPEVNARGSYSFVHHHNVDHSMRDDDAEENEFEDEHEHQSEDDEDNQSEEEEEKRKDLIDSLTLEFTAWMRQPSQMDRVFKYRSFSTDQTASRDDHNEGNGDAHRYWIIPCPDTDTAWPLGWIEPPPPDIGTLVVGATFRSKHDLKVAVGMYHMENRLEYAIDRSASNRLVFICKHGRNNCSFRVCAIEGATIWRITKLTLEHTCYSILDRTPGRRIPDMVIAAYFARRLIGDGVVLRTKDMQPEIHRDFGIDMSKVFTRSVRNMAIDLVYGSFDKSYQMLPSYLYLLQQRNSGTVYDLQLTTDGVFSSMFVALGQSIRAFERYLRPVIMVDGTHLKGKNKGVLFVAVGHDGNEHVFPIAVGIGPIENDETWTWFLYNLRRCFNFIPNLLIVSDGHKSISNAIQSVYPDATHGLCFHHILKNLARYGKHVGGIFKCAAYSYRVEDFEKYFGDLAKISEDGAYARLATIGVEKWARAKCPVRRYGFLTSNGVESLNSRLLWARRLPICSLIEIYRLIVEEWFDKHRVESIKRDHELTEKCFGKLQASRDRGERLKVLSTNTHMYKVIDNRTTYIVDLENWSCECKEFEMDQIPCEHAAAVIGFIRNENGGAGISLHDYVAPYYKQNTLIQTYAERIKPIPHPTEWNVPSNVSNIICLAPESVAQPGRPRMRRARSAVESNATRHRPQVCSRCKESGHNRGTCIAFIPIGGVDLNNPPEENVGERASRRRRQKKKCSICRSLDHTISKCPYHVD